MPIVVMVVPVMIVMVVVMRFMMLALVLMMFRMMLFVMIPLMVFFVTAMSAAGPPPPCEYAVRMLAPHSPTPIAVAITNVYFQLNEMRMRDSPERLVKWLDLARGAELAAGTATIARRGRASAQEGGRCEKATPPIQRQKTFS